MTIANQNAGFALLGDTNTKQPPSGKWIVAWRELATKGEAKSIEKPLSGTVICGCLIGVAI